VTVAGDLHADQRAERALVYAGVAVTHDGTVNVPRYDQDERIRAHPKRPFDESGVEQPECDIQRLAKAPVGVVVDFSSMHDNSDPQLPFRPGHARKACVVVGQKLLESGNGAIQKQHLGALVDRVYEGEDTVTSVYEPVTMALVDSCRAQRRMEQLVELGAKHGLHGIGPVRGTFDVERDDGSVAGQAERQRGFHQGSPRGSAGAAIVAVYRRQRAGVPGNLSSGSHESTHMSIALAIARSLWHLPKAPKA
jgi:hypothetical protein